MRDILLITAIALNMISIPLAIYVLIEQRKLKKKAISLKTDIQKVKYGMGWW